MNMLSQQILWLDYQWIEQDSENTEILDLLCRRD